MRRAALYLAPRAPQVILLLGCIGVGVALGLLPPLFAKWLVDGALPAHDVRRAAVDVGGMIASALAASAVGVSQGYLSTLLAETVRRDLRSQVISHLHSLPISFFAATRLGELVDRACGDVDRVKDAIAGTFIAMFVNVAMLGTTLVTICLLDWRLGGVVLLAMGLMVLPLRPLGRRMSAVNALARQRRDDVVSLAQGTLSVSGITLLKSFGREPFEDGRFADAATELMGAKVRLSMVGRGFAGAISAMTVIGPAFVWLVGAALAMSGAVSTGTIVALVAYLARLYLPASSLAYSQVQMVSALAVFERIFAYLDLAPEAPDTPDAVVLRDVRGDVAFQNVRFSFPGGRVAVDGVDLRIESGKMAAFVGASGAGKTTLTQLLMRLHDPQQGRITIDGHDIRGVTLASLRENVAVVTQESYLFHDTIAANLRYARADATDAEIAAAARAANIHEFVAGLPDGYQTVVGERGHKLSGGERQRLAIARAILKNPRILILDEATSALDSKNEAAIRDALAPLIRGRTTLIVAHRLSTILAADVIFVIANGRIAESGTHDDLLAREGPYAGAYRHQFRDVLHPETADSYVPFSAPR